MPLPKIRKGDTITANYLNRVSDDVDELTEQIFDPPQQVGAPPSPAAQNEGVDLGSINTFVEISRVTSTVQVFDQNEENYAEIERIESVTFSNGAGQSLTLQFTN